MAKKSQKNSKHVADLINSATLPALSLLAQVDKFAFLGVLDATKPEHQARSELLECIPSVKREDITIADQEAVRLLQLLIRPSLFEIHAAYFTCASWKNFFTRSGDFSKACMWAVVAAFSLALVRTGTFV